MGDSVSGPGRPPTVETFERMLQSATYGAQMLESATAQQSQPPPAEAPRSPKRKEPEEVKEPVNGTPGPTPAKRPVRPPYCCPTLFTYLIHRRSKKLATRTDRSAKVAGLHPHQSGAEAPWVSPTPPQYKLRVILN